MVNPANPFLLILPVLVMILIVAGLGVLAFKSRRAPLKEKEQD